MRRTVAGIAAAVATLALFTVAMLPFRSSLSEAMTALVLVVPVVTGVVVGGLRSGVVSVFAGFFVYVYFFVPPYLTTSIGSTQNWVALGVYTVITLPVAYVVDRMHRSRTTERRRAVEIRQLLELSELLVADRPLDELLPTVTIAMATSFAARQVAILLPGDEGLEVAACAGEPVGPDQRSALAARWPPDGGAEGGGAPGTEDGHHVFVLTVAGRSIGLLTLAAGDAADHDEDALRLFTAQVALAIERSALRERAIQTRLAEQVDRLATMLVTAVSHDLRTPLASIKASSSVLADDALALGAGDARRLARLIDSQVDRLVLLVQGLLDMGRIRAGVLVPRPVAVDLPDLIASVVEEITPGAPDGRLLVDLPGDLPPVRVDPALVSRVVANLLANAVRHAPGDTTVRLVARRSGPGTVEVSVLDRGPGVHPGRRAELLGLNARRDSDAGAGSGLAIARTFIEAHGEHLRIEDAPGGGVCFSFSLPLLDPDDRGVACRSSS